jgi:hypothetical protein
VVRTSDRAWYLYWELSDQPANDTRLKIVAWVPRVFGAARIEKDIVVTQASGGLWLPSFGPRAVVRGVLGSGSRSGFVAHAVASVLDRSGDPAVCWSPPAERGTLEAVHARALAALDALPS